MMHISIGIPESSVSSAPVSAVFAAVSASIWRRLEISVLDALTAPSLHIEAIVRRSVSTPSLCLCADCYNRVAAGLLLQGRQVVRRR